MVVAALECRGFRNLADGRLPLSPGIVVFHGPNGAGKTNLVEAVYFGLTGHSFRPGPGTDLIGFDQPSARVELELPGGTLLAGLDRGGERRHRLDGRKLTGSPDERPLVSVFHPDRLQLVKGPAARRRAHLDRLVAALWPARAELRSRFGRTLAQRNSLVSRIRAGLASADSLAAWDERLAAEAEPLIAARAEAVERLATPFGELAGALGLEAASIAYRPRCREPGHEAIADELGERRARDLGRAYTSYGPQLDEVELRVADRPLRRFGSQGQQRVSLLALLFAERAVLIEADRPPPIMLLDDVMSELDPTRRQLLVATLGEAGQALLTATEPEHVPAPGATRIAVREGRTTAAVPGSEATTDAEGSEAA